MTLAELTREEERLRVQVASVTGSMEEKHARLGHLGVFDDYARVHAAYADLAAGGDPEALKRALFLQWYAVSEPPCFSGLYGLEREAERRVLERLDTLVSEDDVDDELQWMLPAYDAIIEFYFDSHEGLSSLKRWLRAHATTAFPSHLCHPSLAGRGQMSDYWYRPDHASGET